MSKEIATRIKNVLPNIIHHNESGYVKDRYIGETVRSIYNLMDFTGRENISGILIFLDFQKVFDTLEWDFLFKYLQCFNFGQDFIHWVKVFYQSIRSCLINNGTVSHYFNLERGVRQGDPLSPYLFILAVETLAISIRSNVLIKGVTLGNEETTLLQYDNDTTAVLSDTHSAQAHFDSLDVFEYLSGLKVNGSKTEGYWIGSLKYDDIKPFGIKWPDEPIKTLGVFTYDQNLIYEKNFKDKLFKIKKLINIWSFRGLSLYGKVTVNKSLVLPKLVYISSLLPTPQTIMKEVNQLIFNFLWKGKDKVTRLSTINTNEEGGLKMTDLDSMIKALRLSWLKRVFSSNKGAWKTYLRYILKDYEGFLLFSCNYNIKD